MLGCQRLQLGNRAISMTKRDQLGSDHALDVCSLLLIFSGLQQQLGLLLKLIPFSLPDHV